MLPNSRESESTLLVILRFRCKNARAHNYEMSAARALIKRTLVAMTYIIIKASSNEPPHLDN